MSSPVTTNSFGRKVLLFGALAVFALLSWQWLPDQYLGPYNAWNPHAIMEFVITLFAISLLGKLIVHFIGSYYGLLLTGLVAGFASSTATIHNLGKVAKSQPHLADRAALGGVLSNIATLVQLVVLLKLLAPQVLTLFVQPLCFGLVGMCAYAAWVLIFANSAVANSVQTKEESAFDWQSLLTLTAVVCAVSYVSAALNAMYGQTGLWAGAAVSGLADAHAIIPSLASLLSHDQLLPIDAVIPLLLALTANTLTKSIIALQAGGWAYARKVSVGVWITTVSVWVGYFWMGYFWGQLAP